MSRRGYYPEDPYVDAYTASAPTYVSAGSDYAPAAYHRSTSRRSYALSPARYGSGYTSRYGPSYSSPIAGPATTTLDVRETNSFYKPGVYTEPRSDGRDDLPPTEVIVHPPTGDVPPPRQSSVVRSRRVAAPYAHDYVVPARGYTRYADDVAPISPVRTRYVDDGYAAYPAYDRGYRGYTSGYSGYSGGYSGYSKYPSATYGYPSEHAYTSPIRRSASPSYETVRYGDTLGNTHRYSGRGGSPYTGTY
mmetsp:Transcript_113434/g.196966  ORF Transcript_113434/g.196966 Transcript_113434/m.196966 type:complete len:248 (-) Transcript_113434:1058-1801(-)